ncbi:protein FAM98B isoform X2 [Parambassis ranga]|uniref:Protein FAM98B isoform X2 n=1 Tax=Parambassis ranga TaxID=210632 RepID=A0A6P7JD09_9TELE|nr:protein FAM98B-like isoform X2 [Parambassis ranga]
MERSVGTIAAIKALGYPGGSCLTRCRCDELPCPLLSWLSAQLRALCPELQDSNRTDDILLMGELRNLLSNMFSPLASLTSELLEPAILNKVTEFLVSELQAAHINKHKEIHPEEQTTAQETEKEQRVEDGSHDTAYFCQEYEDDDERRKAEMQAEWILLLRALDMDASSQFANVLSEVKSRLAQLPSGGMTDPLLNTSLSSEQWERSAVLASVPSLSSFLGSSRVSPSLLLAAREDQSFIDPIKAGTSTPVYKTLMGSVPDRGGRPGEIEPPMPAWGERRAKGNRWGQGGGQHSRHKGSDKKKKGKKE